MAYTTIDNPELYFQSVLWNGNSSTQAITLGGEEDMSPNMVWIKSRNNTGTNNVGNHRNYDSVRGVEKLLYANLTNAEADQSDGLTAFGSNGFTLGNDANSNATNGTYVAWCWKAGTSFTNDASATSVGSIDSSGSTSQSSGFSIVSWTGTGSAGTVAHNLGSVPEWYIIKNRGDANNWAVYHQKSNSNPEQYALYLDGTSAATDDSGLANDTAPTSTVFSLTNGNYGNQSSHTYIGYCFSEVQGFSKFGSYTGNGDADGGFIYLGFRPAWFMCKNYQDAGDNWIVHDNKRDTFNVTDNGLAPNSAEAEFTDVDMDFLSNGVKMRNNTGRANSAKTFIYMAFAESPFVNSNGVPNNAR